MTARWQRADGVLWRMTPAGVVLLPPTSTEPFVLAGSGAQVWGLLVEPRSVDDLVVALTERFEAPPGAIADDVEMIVGELGERRAVSAHR